MTRSEILEKVIEICKDVFEDDDLILTESSSSSDVEDWDSLSHLSLISDVEDEFSIKLTLDEISNSKNLGELVSAIMRHIKGEKVCRYIM